MTSIWVITWCSGYDSTGNSGYFTTEQEAVDYLKTRYQWVSCRTWKDCRNNIAYSYEEVEYLGTK
jgi:hypothetical protein